ncbi:hypothetical protein OAL75_03725 [Candidatus Pelagibacter ubique]|nr:hypothetical protein [Candidatus Pelagibacter ubique]
MIIKNHTIEILIITLTLGLLFYSSDPVLYSDSARYLKGSLNDPPLYSTIIVMMQSAFRTLNSIIILQTLFIGFGIVFFTKTISKYFDLDLLTEEIVAIFLFLPTLKFYNNLLTEALGYAFSLLFVGFVLRLIYNFSIRNLVWTSIFVVSLLLMRNQFIFLYLIVLMLYLGILYISRSKKKLILLAISFIFIIFAHNSLVSLNKYIKKTSFENEILLESESTSIFNFIYIDAVYISSVQDIGQFEDESLKKTFAKIIQEIDSQRALVEYYNGRGHFGISFKIIISESELLLKDLAIQKKTTVNGLKKEISIKLIKSNFKKYLKFLFKKFYDSAWLFIFIPFFMLLAAFISFFKKKTNLTLFLIFLSTFTLSNHSIIYLLGRVQPRYFIYTDFILLIIIFVIFSMFLKIKLR